MPDVTPTAPPILSVERLTVALPRGRTGLTLEGTSHWT